MSGVQKIFTGYFPRKHQEELHAKLKRFNVLVVTAAERFGKTVFAINEMVDQGLRCKKRSPQLAYLAPNYSQAKRVAWEVLKDATKNIPGAITNEQDLRVDILRGDDKIRFMLLGSENPGTIRGIYLDGVIIDEYAECDPTVWGQVVRPALSDRLGWAIFIGTPKGQNHFYDVYKLAQGTEGWFTALYKASETGILPASELEAAKREMRPEEYEQEFECSFSAANVGSYYGKLIEEAEKAGRLMKVPHDAALQVATYWDLGISDATAIWLVQQYRFEYRIIKYIEMSNVGLDWFAKELKNLGYVYSEHVLPHDAAARDLGTGKSRVETLESLLGRGNIRVLPLAKVDDGIHAVQKLLPKCYFDAENCKRGLEALKNYQRKWDAKINTFVPKPLHDWSSHGSDAFRSFAMGVTEEADRDARKNLPTQAQTDYDIYGVY